MEQIHGGDWAAFRTTYGTDPLDFSANVSPLGMPEDARKAAEEALETISRYPDPACRELRRALGEFHGVSPENIVCGAGAADLIRRIVFVLRPEKALVPAPSFTEYERVLEQAGCEVERYFLTEDAQFRIGEDFLTRITEETGLVILCEPGNPSGVTTAPGLLRRILEKIRHTGGYLLADECFLPFLEDAAAHTLLPELPGGGLIILRAFTKFYGMAGLRLGYAMTGDRKLAGDLAGAAQPWPVSSPAQAAGIAALSDTAYADTLRDLIRKERENLQKALLAMGLTVIPGEANFLLFRAPVTDLGEKLAREGILIRDCRAFPGLAEGWYRIAVRSSTDNARLIETLKKHVMRSE